MIDTKLLHLGEWVVRVRIPDGPGPHPVLLLLHGWLGNEDVTWIFAKRLPENYLLVAPRGIYPATRENQFSWIQNITQELSNLEHFKPAVESLIDLLALRPGAPNQNFDQVDIVGFSQGAALGYAFATYYPNRVRKIAGLAGFVPEGVESYVLEKPFTSKKFFVAHGSRDHIVPVTRIRQEIELLENAGAEIMYCEDDVGHKLSANCFRALEKFYHP
jgi:phospholipase/carboxylesterase